MSGQGFSTPEICRIIGLPSDTLYTWMYTGLISPSITKPQGRGNRAKWSFRDLVAIKTVHQLRQHGVSMQGLRRVVRYIQKSKAIQNPLSQVWLLTDGDDVYMLEGKALMSVLRKPGQLTLFHLVDMKKLTEDLRAKVLPLAGKRQRHKEAKPLSAKEKVARSA